MTWLLVYTAIVILSLILTIRHFIADPAKPALDLLTNISAAFAGVFLALIVDDNRKSEENRISGIISLRATSIKMMEETRPVRNALGDFRPIMLTYAEPNRSLVLKRYVESLKNITLPDEDISDVLLKNEHIASVIDEALLVDITRSMVRRRQSAKYFNSDKGDAKQSFNDLQNFFQITDDIFIKVCMAQGRLENKLSESEYQRFLSARPSDENASKDFVDNVIIRTNCKPLWSNYDLQQYIMRRAQQ